VKKNYLVLTCAAALAVSMGGAVAPAAAQTAAGKPKQADKKAIERGRYMVIVGGCNDCHTDGFPPRDGKVPESEWLLGSGPLGFRGPWGTTYAPNLRLTVSRLGEDQWVKYAKELKTRPPMPWFNLNKWSEADLRATYRYIRQMGPVGNAAAAYVPPDKEPKPPFVQWPGPPK
jgi:mono/diheme cytochrome c family protein